MLKIVLHNYMINFYMKEPKRLALNKEFKLMSPWYDFAFHTFYRFFTIQYFISFLWKEFLEFDTFCPKKLTVMNQKMVAKKDHVQKLFPKACPHFFILRTSLQTAANHDFLYLFVQCRNFYCSDSDKSWKIIKFEI